MERTIFEADDGLAVLLPQELLEALDLRRGSRVRVVLDPEHGGILVAPAEGADESADPAFDALIDEFIEEYRPALEALAKR